MSRFFARLGLALGLIGAALAAQAQTLTPVKIRLDWKGGAQHAPFYLGKLRGYYRDAGIDLDIIQGSGSSDTVKQVGAKTVEFGLVDALVLVQAAAQRVPVKSVFAYYERTPIVVISPKTKPITDPKQLTQGVKLGSKKGSATFQGLMALEAANGINPEDVSTVDVGFGVQPLLTKQVDALMGFSMNEPIEAESAGLPVATMPIAEHGVDAYGLTIVTTPDLLAKNPALVQKFVAATAKAVEASMADPAAAVEAVKASVEEIDAKREGAVLASTIPYWKSADAHASVGAQSEAHWTHTIDVARKLGLIDTPLVATAVFTDVAATN